jgi:hypothetical protein
MNDVLQSLQEAQAILKQQTQAETTPQPVKNYRITEKYKRWEELFFDKHNKETYGNATRSALVAYSLDEKTQYNVAAQIGMANMRKHENIIGKYYEGKGVTAAKMYDILFDKMLMAKNPDLLFAIAEKMGVLMPDYKPVSSPQVYINSTTNSQTNIQGDMTLAFTKEDKPRVDEK